MKNPQIDTPATLIMPDDRYPYVVTKVSNSGNKIVLRELKTVDFSTGHKPAPNSGYGIWDHTYTPEEVKNFPRTGKTITAFWSDKRNCYLYDKCIPVRLGEARYFRDFND